MKCTFKLLVLLILFLFWSTVHAQYQNTPTNSVVWRANTANISTEIKTDNNEVCKGSTPLPKVTFTATGGTAPYTFTYSGNGATKQKITTSGTNNSISINVNISNAGTIVYTLDSVASSLETAEAVTGKQVSIKVNELPNADFSFSNDNQCPGTDIVFTPTVTPLAAYTFHWDFGDGSTSTQSTPIHKFYSSGTGTQKFNVKLTLTNKATSCVGNSNQDVTVKRGSDISITSDASLIDFNGYKTFTKCENTSQELTFYNASTTAGTNTNYNIDWGDGTANFSALSWSTLTHRYNPGLWSLKYSITSQTGCVVIFTYKVFVGSNPSVSLGNPGNTDVCNNTALTFPITGTDNNPFGTTYTISFNDGSTPVVFNHPPPSEVTHTFLKSSCGITSSNGTISFPNSFSATIIAANPCGTSSVGVVPIYVSTSPVANFSTSKSIECVNKQICLSNLNTNATQASTSGCVDSKIIWNIQPNSGFNLSSGTLGNDFNSTNYNAWLSGSNNICPIFTLAGQYIIKMRIANKCGIDEKTDTICIEPTPAPIFTLDKTEGCAPLSVQTANATNELSSCGSGMTYKWEISYTASNCGTTKSYTMTSTNGTNIPNGTSTSKNTTINFINPGTYNLKLTATNSCGSISSSTQTITVKAPPTATINDITTACQNPGGTVISPIATVNNCGASALTYEWSFPDGNPSSSTSATPGNITYATAGTKNITLKVSNECSSDTASKSFTISPAPTVNDIANQTKCAGSTSDAVIFSGTNASAYKWTNNTPSIGLVTSGTGNIPAFQTINTGNTELTATITVTPVNGSCSGTPKTFTITVKPALKATAAGSTNLCKTNSTHNISFTGENGTPPYTFTYQLNNGANQTISSPAGSATAAISVNLNTAGTFVYKLINVSDASALSCTQAVNSSATVIVSEVPNIVKNYTQTICNSSSTTIKPALDNDNTVPSGTSYNWTAPTVVPAGSVTGASAQATYISELSFPALLNTTTSPATVTYTVTPKAGDCNGLTFTVQLTVQPSPIITFSQANQQICSGNTSSEVSLSSTTPGSVSFSWIATVPVGVTGVQTSGTDRIPAQTLVNSTNIPQTIFYKAKAKIDTRSSCDGAEYIYQITVQPTPLVTGLSTVTLCNNELNNGIQFTSNVAGAGFSWTNDNTSIGLAASGTGNIPSFTATNSGLTDQIANIKVTPTTNGCTGTESSFIITVHPSPTVDQPTNQIVCNGYSTTDIIFTGTISGTTYEWSHNKPGIGISTSNTGDILGFKAINTGSTPIVVTFTVTPKYGGCNGTAKTFTITINPSPVFTSQPVSESLCENGTPAKLSVSYNNATSIPTFQWFENTVRDSLSGIALPGETNSNYQPTGNTTGTKYYYCVLTFPSGGCSTLVSNVATVTVNPLPVISENPLSTQQICVGGTIQPLVVKYTGGSGTPQYQWYKNTTNTNAGGIAVLNAKSATFTPDAFTSTGNFYYYVVVNFNDGGCGSIVSQPAEIIVVSDPVITIQPKTSQTVCQGSTPDLLSVIATGGIGTYNYQWYEMTLIGSDLISGATQANFTPSTDIVGTRKYYCVVSQVGLGCSVTSNIGTVTINKSPTFTAQPISAVYCKNENPVALKVAYTDGVGTAHYQWYSNTTNSTIGATALTGENTDTFTPTTNNANTIYYYCTITLSEGGCSRLTSNIAEIKVNQYPVISDYNREIGSGKTFIVQPSPVSSSDRVPTGTSYTWSQPEVFPANSISGASAQLDPLTTISQTLTNNTKSVATATYTVLPIANNCPGATFKIIVKVNPPINAIADMSDVSCFGANDGSISISIEGGNPPYITSWTGPNSFNSDQTTISNLQPGEYQLKVTDNGGLPFNTSYTIKEPEVLKIVDSTKKDITCHGAANGEISLTIAGGNLPYSIIWKKDNSTFSLSEDLTSLSPGFYEVTVDDKNHCGPVKQSFTIIEPEPLDIQLNSKINNLCAGDKNGSIEVLVSGGVKKDFNGILDYEYQWAGPNGFTATTKNISGLYSGTYMLSVSDASGCSTQFSTQITEPDSIKVQITTTPITCYGADDASIKLDVSGGVAPYTAEWDNLASGFFQPNLSAKNYIITITDANNCVKTVHVPIPEAPVFKITPVVKQISCFGAHDGSIKLNIEGGQGNVSLKWSDNSTAGNERNNIGPGTYTVTITDGKPCYITRTFIIQEPQELKISAKTSNAFDCDNTNSGAIDLEVTGGTLPYTFTWSNGMSTEDLTNIPPGNYFVEVSDARACSLSEKFEITRQLPISIKVETSYNYNCINKKLNQLCTAKVSGGIPPYKLTWSSGNISGTNNEIMETDRTASVILTVEDALGCNKSYMFNTNVPDAGINTQLLDCNNHTFQFNFTMPDKILTNTSYSWDFGDGATAAIRNPTHTYMNHGTYPVSVKVTSTECSTTFNELIVVDSLPVLRLNKPAKLCKNDSVKLFITGADFYDWSDGSKGDSIVIKLAGDYQVTGTTKNGCTAVLNFTSTYYDNVNYSIITDKDDITAEDPTVKFWSQDISLSKYLWNFGDGNSDYGNYIYHTYDVNKGGYIEVLLTATNPNGCIETASKKIWMSLSAMPNTFTPNGDGDNDVFLKGWNLQVYNSNGVLLYEGIDGWDGTYNGKPVSSDTYYYVVVVYTPKGSESKANFVTIVR